MCENDGDFEGSIVLPFLLIIVLLGGLAWSVW